MCVKRILEAYVLIIVLINTMKNLATNKQDAVTAHDLILFPFLDHTAVSVCVLLEQSRNQKDGWSAAKLVAGVNYLTSRSQICQSLVVIFHPDSKQTETFSTLSSCVVQQSEVLLY